MKSDLSICFFINYVFSIVSKKSLTNPKSQRFSPSGLNFISVMFCSFQCIDLEHILLNLSLGISYFYAIINAIVLKFHFPGIQNTFQYVYFLSLLPHCTGQDFSVQ